MDKDVIRKFGSYLERASWSLVFFGLLTQVSSEFAFPSYNVVLGFWGAYCSFARHGRATFACIMFTLLAVVLDVAFCAVNGAASGTFYFALTMFVLCLLLKCVVIYAAAHFFAALGGASSMDTSLHGLPMDVSRSGHFDNLGAFSVLFSLAPFPLLTATFVCVRCSVLRHVGRQPSGQQQRRRAVLSPDRGPRVVAHHIGGPRGAGGGGGGDGGRARRDGGDHAARQGDVHIAGGRNGSVVCMCYFVPLHEVSCSA